MAGQSNGRGQDLLDLFIRSGCNEASTDDIRGEDLDWVWEMCKDDEETRDFLSWICDSQTLSYEENVLTNEELQKWEKLQKERPDTILSGRRLQEALHIVRQDEALLEEEKLAQKSDEALSSFLTEKREILESQECQLEELNRLHLNLNTRKSKSALKVSQSEEKKERLDKELVRKQQTTLHLNNEHNSAVDSLGDVVRRIQEKVDKNIRKERCNGDLCPTSFLGRFDKHALIREDAELSKKIREYIEKKFKQTQDTDAAKHTLVKEHSQSQYEKRIAEVDRLQNCHQNAKMENIIRSAEMFSANAAKEEIEKQTRKLIQGQISLEIPSLQSTISELHSHISELQNHLNNMVKDKLPIYLQEDTKSYCQSISEANIEARIKRQKDMLMYMDIVLEFLLKQGSYQEALGLIIENEGNGILELKERLAQISILQSEETDLDEKENIHMEIIKDFKDRRSKKTLQPEDTFLIALHRLLTDSNIDPNFITEHDVQNLVSNFASKINDLDKLVTQTEIDWKRQKVYIEGLIERLQKELQIDSQNRCTLISAEVNNKIKLAENKVRIFETTVRKKIAEWEDLKREIKGNPFLATQKKFAGTNIIENYSSILK